MPRPSAECLARSIGKGEQPIPTTTTHRAHQKGRQEKAHLEKQQRLRGHQAAQSDQRAQVGCHRKSLHGRKVHELVAVGNTMVTEQISYKGWQKRYGKNMGLRAPGMFIEMLRRTVASTGGTLHEIPTRSTKLSQYCHGCGRCTKKPLSQRLSPVRLRHRAGAARSVFGVSGGLCQSSRTLPLVCPVCHPSESAEARMRAAHERTLQRANAGQVLPRSMGIPRARARLPESRSEPAQETIFLLRRGRWEAWNERSEPPAL